MTDEEARAALASVRDPRRSPQERAQAATALAADADAVPVGETFPTTLFGYGERHAAAVPWDGRSARVGTITYASDERIEQYAGGGRWIWFPPQALPPPLPAVGDQVRVSAAAGRAALERVGPNRLPPRAPVTVRSSGIALPAPAARDLEATASIADAVRARYPEVALEVRRDGDQLRCEVAAPVSDREACLRAERALLLAAAALALELGVDAFDDVGARYELAELETLAARNGMRADLFAFAAAAARRRWPPAAQVAPLHPCGDALLVFVPRPWDAADAAAAVRRAVLALAAGADRNDDPVLPADGGWGDGDVLVRLASERVELAVMQVIEPPPRPDVEALLGAPVMATLLLVFGNRGDDASSDDFVREMHRADTIATALAATLARERGALAADVTGTLVAPETLIALALARRGRAPLH